MRDNNRMNRYFKTLFSNSLRARLTRILVLAISATSIAALFFLYRKDHARIHMEYAGKGVAMARTAACLVDGETVDRYLESLEKDAAYMDTLRHLKTLQKESGVKYIYVARIVEDGAIFVFDTDEVSPVGLGVLDEWNDSYDIVRDKLLRGEPVVPVTLDVKWGRLLVTYEPILRSDESVAGYVGVDISMDQVEREQRGLFISTGLLLALLLGVSFALHLYIIDRIVIFPIGAIVDNISSFMPAVSSNTEGCVEALPSADYKTQQFNELDILELAIADMKSRIHERKIESEKSINTLKSILNGIDAFICVTVPETCEILFLNSKMIEEFGIEGDGVGQLCYEIIGKGMNERCDFCPYHQLEKEPEKVIVWEEYEQSINRTHRKMARFIPWPEGRIGHLEYGIDITETLRLQEKLEASLLEAQEASRAKSEFLSRMSHEMRTPMNAIIGMAAIGKNARDTERRDYALNKVEEASAHLLGIINDVLDITKIEDNKLELAPVWFDLEKTLQKAVSFVRFRMDEKKQKFSMSLDDKIPHSLVGDEQRLTQVITNLLSNAVKFTPEEGEISLDVFGAGKADGIYELRVEVADSGIGISPEHQEKIFHEFEQAEGGIDRKFGGTGLGLAISKRIVERMGGTIWVESQPGGGSRFIFTVKLLCDGDDTSSQPVPLITYEEHNDEVTGEFAGKRLLLAEDVEINREVLISLLDGTGLVIDIAQNGCEALAMVTAAPDYYDLVFMDIQMPEMDGLEATRRIRALPGTGGRKLPIIALTANVYQEDIENCHAVGMDAHIGKPLEINEVFAKLRKYLI